MLACHALRASALSVLPSAAPSEASVDRISAHADPPASSPSFVDKRTRKMSRFQSSAPRKSQFAPALEPTVSTDEHGPASARMAPPVLPSISLAPSPAPPPPQRQKTRDSAQSGAGAQRSPGTFSLFVATGSDEEASRRNSVASGRHSDRGSVSETPQRKPPAFSPFVRVSSNAEDDARGRRSAFRDPFRDSRREMSASRHNSIAECPAEERDAVATQLAGTTARELVVTPPLTPPLGFTRTPAAEQTPGPPADNDAASPSEPAEGMLEAGRSANDVSDGADAAEEERPGGDATRERDVLEVVEEREGDEGLLGARSRSARSAGAALDEAEGEEDHGGEAGDGDGGEGVPGGAVEAVEEEESEEKGGADLGEDERDKGDKREEIIQGEVSLGVESMLGSSVAGEMSFGDDRALRSALMGSTLQKGALSGGGVLSEAAGRFLVRRTREERRRERERVRAAVKEGLVGEAVPDR